MQRLPRLSPRRFVPEKQPQLLHDIHLELEARLARQETDKLHGRESLPAGGRRGRGDAQIGGATAGSRKAGARLWAPRGHHHIDRHATRVVGGGSGGGSRRGVARAEELGAGRCGS